MIFNFKTAVFTFQGMFIGCMYCTCKKISGTGNIEIVNN